MGGQGGGSRGTALDWERVPLAQEGSLVLIRDNCTCVEGQGDGSMQGCTGDPVFSFSVGHACNAKKIRDGKNGVGV